MNQKKFHTLPICSSFALPCLLLAVAIACSVQATDDENDQGSGGQANTGGGDGDGGNEVTIPTEGPVAAADLPLFMAQIICQKVEECGCAWEELGTCQQAGQCFTDEAHCRASLGRALQVFSVVHSSFSAEYDPDAGRACLDAGLASGCDQIFWDASCQETIVGTAALGEPCTLPVECVGFHDGSSHCAEEGVCASGPDPTSERPRGTEGSACSATCGEGIGCVTILDEYPGDAVCHIEDGLRCVSGVCDDVVPDGSPCDELWDCETGTFCDRASRRCTPFTEVGQSCNADDERPCGASAFCDGSMCANLRNLGQPCEWNEECASGECADHGRCVEKGTRPVCAL